MVRVGEGDSVLHKVLGMVRILVGDSVSSGSEVEWTASSSNCISGRQAANIPPVSVIMYFRKLRRSLIHSLVNELFRSPLVF